ncbi:MAG: hypothetical protein KBS42_04060, partial [Bacteroidales bacterium]|nr:hypothetical protein [Candidatus Colicola coprequi]
MAINVYFLSPFRGLGGLFSTFCLLPFAFCLLPFISVYRLEEDDTLWRRGWCEDRISTGKLVFMENHELIASGAFSTHPFHGVLVGFCSLYHYFVFDNSKNWLQRYKDFWEQTNKKTYILHQNLH